jgi:DNA-binding response OmpR family regulator
MELLRRERYRPRVLVADDESLIADSLRAILDKNGFDAIVAYDGEAAVDAAHAWRPDIFLGDVMMPRMNGIEAAVIIRAMLPECRVILFSGAATTADLQRDARIRGHSFEVLGKPIHPAELLARLWCSLAPGY